MTVTTARDNAQRAARALLRVRATAVAGYALSAAAVCTGVVAFGRARGWLPEGLEGLWPSAIVCALWIVPIAALHRATPPPPVTVDLGGGAAPELELLVRQLALQLQVPAPAGIELSPDCDAWLDPRPGGPVLVIGSPFLWWLRVSELRGLLAPLVAGMAAAGDERIVRARTFAARSVGALRGRPGTQPAGWRARAADYCAARAEVLERVVAWEAVAASRMIEPAARAYAHEQINLAAAGWDRVLTRLAQPAWEAGVCPVGLNVALVGALTALGRRDRMAGGLTGRLAERPACDLLEEPGAIDAQTSRLAAELFDGRRLDRTVGWEQYVAAVTEPAVRRQAETVPTGHPAAKRIRALVASAAGGDHGGGGGGGVGGGVGGAPAGIPKQNRRPDSDVVPDQEALAAYLAVGLVDAGLARWRVDWLDGVQLQDRRGAAVPVEELTTALADGSDATRLTAWLDAR